MTKENNKATAVAIQDTYGAVSYTHLDVYKRQLMNLANCGEFSSDRTVREYVRDIWKVETIQ